MALKKKDFIELEFTGRVKGGEIFDSNIAEDIKKAGLGIEPKPFIFSLGEDMFLKAIDEFLIGKEKGKYSLELPPEKAFGKRDSKLIMKIPLSVFAEQKVNPVHGAVFNFDGRIAKIIAVSGGRVIADFNNPLAGREVVYDLEVKRVVQDLNEKVRAFISFLFRRDIDFEVAEGKIILKIEPQLGKFAGMFGQKFKEVFGMDLEVKELKKPGAEKQNTDVKKPSKKPQ
jgi:FKBP-type peptidyl-prolyl cis-trans isomerase 2